MKVLERKDVDVLRWDTMIWNANNALFYNLSWSLDTLCTDWVAVMKDDYETALAFPIKTKAGLKYTYNPFLFHRVSTIGHWTEEEIDEAIWMVAKYVDVRIREEVEGAVSWNNCELELTNNYLETIQSYSSNAKRNIKKAVREGLVFNKMNNAALISFFFKENVSFNALGIKEKEYENFEKLMLEAFDCEVGHGFTVVKGEDVVAVGFFIELNGRLTYVKGTSNEIGRTDGAMHFLFDRVINKFSGQLKLLDFSGSDVDSVAKFYRSFGAKNKPIGYLKRNHLPFPLNHLKK